jgi:Domain of Unknown Function (DUF1206)
VNSGGEVEPDRDLVTTVVDAAADAVRGGGDAPGRWVEVLGRVGLVAYGALHALIAALIIRTVVGARDALDIDQDGAVALVASVGPSGLAVLWIAVTGLVAFGVWQVCAAAGGFRWVTGGERTRKRIGAAAKAIAVFAVAVVALPVLVGEPSRRAGGGAVAVTATLLGLPGGRLLVGLVAGVALVMAGSMVYTGARATFIGDLHRSRLSARLRRVAVVCGSAGNFARAAAFGLVGLSFGAAALTGDPTRSAGVNGVLRSLATTPAGVVALLGICAGIAAFGVYCVIDAYARRA